MKKWRRQGKKLELFSESLIDDAVLVRKTPPAEQEDSGCNRCNRRDPHAGDKRLASLGQREPTIPNQMEITLSSRISQKIRTEL